MKNFYVYYLIDSRNNVPFYVGKGKENRMYQHEECVKKGIIPNNNLHLFRKIKNITDEKKQIVYKKILENSDEVSAWDIETKNIQKLRNEGVKLCNIASGGLGGNTWDNNPRQEEIRKRCNVRQGKRWTLEVKKKISDGLRRYAKNNVHYRFGRKHSIETKKKIGQSNRGGKTAHFGKDNHEYINLENRKNFIINSFKIHQNSSRISRELFHKYKIKASVNVVIDRLKSWSVYDR